MSLQIKHTDNYLGFMDGYVAGNISANESELKLHSDRIKAFLGKIEETFVVIEFTEGAKESLMSTIESFVKKTFNNLVAVDDFYNYSQDLLEVMSAIKNTIPAEKLPTDANFYIKRTIFHFLTIAKTLNDKRITEAAFAIATLFK